MTAIPRKKSPRVPSLALDEAIERVKKVYDKEARHEAPIEVVAQDIGYKSNTSGAAQQALASLRYYGLLHRPREGYLAVTPEVEKYLFTPEESTKEELLLNWLQTPAVFSELLQGFQDKLPSDANIRFKLIEMGFTASTANDCVSVFRQSVEFAKYYEAARPKGAKQDDETEDEPIRNAGGVNNPEGQPSKPSGNLLGDVDVPEDLDKYPIRLAKGRKAWIAVPTPFYKSDKDRLIAQINVLFTDDEDADL